MGPRPGLTDAEKRTFFTLPGLELRPLAIPTALSRLLGYSSTQFNEIQLNKLKQNNAFYVTSVDCIVREMK
jgi:hypothetical protein